MEVLNVFKNSELVKEEFRRNNLPKNLDSVSIKKKIKSNQNKIKIRIKRIENINQKLEENSFPHY